MVPIEIALKIANKIKANERFSAYIVVPMWPEGNPTGAATQRILYWQVCLSTSFLFCLICFDRAIPNLFMLCNQMFSLSLIW